jgi:hypothetical protein
VCRSAALLWLLTRGISALLSIGAGRVLDLPRGV